jgi:small subunit ribosomal protein S1
MTQKLSVGQRIIGRVIKIMPFGAFVELDTPERVGLVRIPEISWQRIQHPGDVLAEGQMVEVEILALEPDNRFSLSIKRCQKPPQ